MNTSSALAMAARNMLSGGNLLATVLLIFAWSGAVLPVWAQISVSGGGQASTGLPIAVPPGIAGMTPNLSLNYSDGGVNGPVGVGWSVQGISTITRCGASLAIDGKVRNVMLDGSDKLCMDGQRLIQTNESGVSNAASNSVGIPVATQANDATGLAEGAAYREFRTEKDSYARIRAYGSFGGDPAKGPARFKVWTKSGLVYEYGLTTQALTDSNAQITTRVAQAPAPAPVVMVWAVRRISDSFQNYMDFRYAQSESSSWGSGPGAPYSGKEWNLREVVYTGTPGQAPTNKVVFEYVSRDPAAAPGHDLAEAYQLYNKNVSTQLLKSITTYLNAPVGGDIGNVANAVGVKSYVLGYERSPITGRSRLTSVKECTVASLPATQKCLPPTTFAYRNSSAPLFVANSAFAGSPIADLVLTDAETGNYGVLTGDFDGDGRSDVLRWSNTASENRVYRSLGSGGFSLLSSNLTAEALFKADGCFTSMVADFNGDGLSDILRVAKSGCTPMVNTLFLSTGDGSFQARVLPAEIDLRQIRSSSGVSLGACGEQRGLGSGSLNRALVAPFTERYLPVPPASRPGRADLTAPGTNALPPGESCRFAHRPLGRRYYILDVNGDGLLDIVTTAAPPYRVNLDLEEDVPSESALCQGAGTPAFVGPCTKVYAGTPSGEFSATAMTIAPQTANASLYSHPPTNSWRSNPYWYVPDQADINGDGLQDILATYSGRWRSMGDGNFASASIEDDSQLCGLPIDFNGDGRIDCLRPDATASNQKLTLSFGPQSTPHLTQFDLVNAGQNLYAKDEYDRQNVGVIVEDFDGDGRQDILRWGPSPSADNGIFFSRGDGSFRPREPAGLHSIPYPLQTADGKKSFAVGDFLGTGAPQILHMTDGTGAQGRGANAPAADRPLVDDPEEPGQPLAKRNQLYYRPEGGIPQDVLVSVTSPTGLTSSVGTRQALTQGLSADGSGYKRDTDQPALTTPAIVNLQPPMYVITATTRDTGAGTLTTRYRYEGMKAERGGRGMLGFRQMQQQDQTPQANTMMTVVTDYLLQHPYIGVAWQTQTYMAGLGATGVPLSATINTYCVRGSSTAPESAVPQSPCIRPAGTLVSRPYLYKTVESGKELEGGHALPTVTTLNTYNDHGDPVLIEVTTTATLGGESRSYTKVTTNTFCDPGASSCAGVAGASPNNISGENWILGRLSKATVRSTAPSVTLTPSAGSSSTARATSGTPPAGTVVAINPGVLQAIIGLILED